MRAAARPSQYICSRCIRRAQSKDAHDVERTVARRAFATTSRRIGAQAVKQKEEDHHEAQESSKASGQEEGAMSRRLAEMTDNALETGGRSAAKAVSEAGFSEDLRRQLEDKIAGSTFRSKNAQALAQAGLSSNAGQGTRDIAGAAPWTGSEAMEDAALRMLNDAHKPLRGGSRFKPPKPMGPPVRLEPNRKPSASARLVNARDKTSIYSTMTASGMSETEKEAFRKEMKARFEPASRALPATLQGLASLANERIEDAIARGQFKNIPRGKQIVRDHNADSPFIDTTEYIMNKMIQRQDIVPPWIEKQQELTSLITKFRARLRNDWRRHAARSIASRGGPLEDQIRRAEAYAKAEAVDNPPKTVRQRSSADDAIPLSKIGAAGQLVTAVEETPSPTIAASIAGTAAPGDSADSSNSAAQPAETPVAPYRDPAWEKIEYSYQNLTIQNINALTRSYNLIAPQVAQRPLYNLNRELRNCYADVAPQLAEAIRERARAPPPSVRGMGARDGRDAGSSGRRALLDDLVGGRERARVYDEDFEKKGYGFKQFWKDLFKGGPVV